MTYNIGWTGAQRARMLFQVAIYLECDVDKPEELEHRFRQYSSLIVSAPGHADREEPAAM